VKITQAQMRVLRSMLESKASQARLAQAKLAASNRATNEAAVQHVYDAVEKKYSRRIHKESKLVFTGQGIVQGWRSAISFDVPDTLTEEIKRDLEARLAKIEKIGDDSTSYVSVPSLNMVDCSHSRYRNDSALEVPTCEVAEWRKLANEIDAAFLSGDASELANVISSFNSATEEKL
jgi:hypothetical protein